MKKINIVDVVASLFVFLFMYAATSKLIEFDLFRAQIGKSPLIMFYSDWVAWMVPAIEIIIALLLVLPRTQLFALYSSFFLMLLFTGYIFFILNFSPYVPCSCGGILSSMGWTEHLIFNIGFTLLAVVGIGFHYRINTRINQTVLA